ncbi:hypothetical protein DFJ74DRAFT_650472 [Hyaloraphidium curvatum]|nr:hypothetical protein DFJ74DRAFT_650472 [Hyaloraphidium curvatum]
MPLRPAALAARNSLRDALLPAATTRGPEMAGKEAKVVDSKAFFSEYHGHTIKHLAALLPLLPPKPRIWLAGDSSLDSKFWFPASAWRPAANGYEAALDPPRSRPDVAHQLNDLCAQRKLDFVAVNCAVEESTLASRSGGLREQDAFVRDHMGPEDVLVVSVGGNDIALRPSLTTMASMGALMALASDKAIDSGSAVGLGHFVDMFGPQVARYVGAICEKTKPRLVIPCMIYFPHEKPGGSWADTTLSLLQYNSNPSKLQKLIRKVYELGTCSVRVEGSKVAPCPLFEVLDPKPESGDYIARVEPSEDGGRKMAERFLEIIDRECSSGAGTANGAP